MDITLEPPSSEGNGRSINIDLNHRVKRKINNLYFVDLKSGLTHTDANSAYPAGRGTYLSSYNSIHIVPITGPDPNFIRVWEARHPSEDTVDSNYRDDKHLSLIHI